MIAAKWGRVEAADEHGLSQGMYAKKENPVVPIAVAAVPETKHPSYTTKGGKTILLVMRTMPVSALCGGCTKGDKVELIQTLPDGNVLASHTDKPSVLEDAIESHIYEATMQVASTRTHLRRAVSLY
jgi:hypothetical protein